MHAVRSVLEHRPDTLIAVWVQDGVPSERFREIIERCGESGISVHRKRRSVMESHAGPVRHQGILALLKSTEKQPGEDELPAFLAGLEHPPFILVLDCVQDPHNLGACLRTCDAAGVDMLIIPKDKAVGLTAVARKVACGAAEHVPLFQVTNLARVLRMLQDHGVWLVGADANEDAATPYVTDLSGALALVLGAEGKGLRRKTREICDFLVRIPMAGSVQSLNVSVATGILLFEALRQRKDFSAERTNVDVSE